MAKSSNRGGGDGTSDRGGVRTTLTPAFPKGTNKGDNDTMKGPFNQPRTGGDNGLPTCIDDDLRSSRSAVPPTMRDSLDTIETNPNAARR